MATEIETTLKEFIEEFEKIKKLGFVDSKRIHDTGIGKTFEDLMGVVENNKPSADFKGLIEIKSARELSSAMLTLFTKSPEPKGINTILKNKFGYSDGDYSDLNILHTTFSGNDFNNSKGNFGFKLDVDNKTKNIFIRIKNLKTNKEEDVNSFYPFEIIKNILETKLKYIIFIDTECKKEAGKELFKFNRAKLLSGLTLEKFITLVNQGIIKYDFRLGVYRTGKNKGKAHDHGSGFRILKGDIEKAFEVTEIA